MWVDFINLEICQRYYVGPLHKAVIFVCYSSRQILENLGGVIKLTAYSQESLFIPTLPTPSKTSLYHLVAITGCQVGAFSLARTVSQRKKASSQPRGANVILFLSLPFQPPLASFAHIQTSTSIDCWRVSVISWLSKSYYSNEFHTLKCSILSLRLSTAPANTSHSFWCMF